MLKILFLSVCLFVKAFALWSQTPRFESQTIDTSVAIGYGLALGDVDGDGKPDILLADKKQFVWYRNGDWKRFVMIDSLTTFDNVCIAAKDITGDGKVEVAVGAQWNPGETSDPLQSGSVHYLVRPSDPTRLWTAVKLPHEPTVHRMQWVKSPGNQYRLIVVPLHGRGNKDGKGEGVRILSYLFPQDVTGSWKVDTLDKRMHLTHNFEVQESPAGTTLYVGGKEGISAIDLTAAGVQRIPAGTDGVGEIRLGRQADGKTFFATIEPMHGNQLVLYQGPSMDRKLLDTTLREGHALAVGDLLAIGSDQVVAGWRGKNREGKVGIKLYLPDPGQATQWTSIWIDENGMACEDLKLLDMDGNGKLDIVAAGRATHNLKIYWNR